MSIGRLTVVRVLRRVNTLDAGGYVAGPTSVARRADPRDVVRPMVKVTGKRGKLGRSESCDVRFRFTTCRHTERFLEHTRHELII